MSREVSQMKTQKEEKAVSAPREAEGARRATGASPGAPGAVGPLRPGQRWSVRRKREVVLRMLRGESLEALSRELGVETYRLQAWRDRALEAMEAGLRSRRRSQGSAELDAALKRIGELTMENELLRARCEAKDPLARRRSRR